MQVHVRPARLEDAEWMLGQLKLFSDFLGTKRPMFGDQVESLAILKTLIEKHVVLVAEKSSIPVGFIGGTLSAHPFNSKIKVLAELFWWVDPVYRGTRAGLMLLNKWTEFGKQAGVDWITVSLEHKSPVKDSALLRRGYLGMEKSFLMEVVH